ncbi:MAG: hypothetical protein WCY54_03525, partial [Syntrophales bacterium]
QSQRFLIRHGGFEMTPGEGKGSLRFASIASVASGMGVRHQASGVGTGEAGDFDTWGGEGVFAFRVYCVCCVNLGGKGAKCGKGGKGL